jgi:hypothetical protein
VLFSILLAAAPSIPDSAKGEIDGHVALMFWPGVATESGVKPLSKEGCTVHMILADDQSRESVYPCGEWFQPEISARFIAWMEEPGLVSYQRIVGYAHEPFHGRGFIGVDTLSPAANVALDRQVKLQPDQTFRIVALKTETNLRMFDRRIRADRAAKGSFQVPAGNVVAGVFNATGQAIALTHAVPARAAAAVIVSPRAPKKGGDALVVIDRTIPPKLKVPDCNSQFVLAGKDRPPAVNVVTRDRLLYVWYDLDPGIAHFTVRCGDKTIDRKLSVTKGNVVTFRDELL